MVLHRTTWRVLPGLALSLALTACGLDRSPPTVVDGSVVLEDGGTELLLEVGTGTQSFEPLEPGQPVPIIAGPQGGYHIWTAIRVRAPVKPDGLTLHVRLIRDGAAVQQTTYVKNLVRRGAYHEAYALFAMVPDPAAIAGQEVLLAVDVEDVDGLAASDARSIVPQAP